MRTAIILLLAAWVVLGALEPMPGQAPTKLGAATATALGRLPLYFVENRGVYPEVARYYIQGADKTLFFTDAGVTFSLKGKDKGWTVKLDFVGANQDARPEGLDKQEAVFSYFRGSEKDWKAGLLTFSKIVYRDIWPGIDLVYNGTVNKLKYEFVVAPGADPSLIRLQYRGASSVTGTTAGALRVETPNGSFEDAPPVAWQDTDGKRVPVNMAYALGDEGKFGFKVSEFDRTKPLILDPAVIVYCGYIGGSGDDPAFAVAVDTSGNAFVVGSTTSSAASFPEVVGPSVSYSGGNDAFVAKIDSRGTALTYCGYIGGTKADWATGVTVDSSGRAYVAGATESSQATDGFPSKVGPKTIFNGGRDAFVARINAKGTGLDYCGYIGGTGVDHALDVAVDSKGAAYVGGMAGSDEKSFPVKDGPYVLFAGGTHDAFVAKVTSTGSTLTYCGYIGGSALDHVTGIAVDSAGCAYVNGYTDSTDIPVKVGPDTTHNGGVERFVAKVDASGKSLVYCGFVGGKGRDSEYGSRPRIAVDKQGCAYVTGETKATNLPVKVGPYPNHAGTAPLTNGWDAFVAKVNASGSGFDYCGYIGGTHDDHGTGIAVDAAGNAYVTGYTWSNESTFPVVRGPDLSFNASSSGNDAFIAMIDPQGKALVYCGYIGGSGQDFSHGVAVDSAGSAYVAGYTRGSTEKTFPVVGGPDLTYNGGSDDAFIVKIALALLQGSGTLQPGTSVNLTLTANDDAGLSYVVGSSLGIGPIRIGTRMLGLGVDKLLEVSVGGVLPTVFVGYQGVIGANGQATAKINLPNIAGLIGNKIHTAFVTVGPKSPQSIKSISNTYSFTITK